jgi:hypothetical protein
MKPEANGIYIQNTHHMSKNVHLTRILIQITYVIILFPVCSHIYTYIYIYIFRWLTVLDIQLDRAFGQGTHVLLECMA